MKSLLTLCILIVVGVACLGFYRGWFEFSKGDAKQNESITIKMDQEKIQQDKDKAQKKLQEVEQKVKEKAPAKTDKATKPE